MEGILKDGSDADLLRMRSLCEATLRAINIEVFDRKIGMQSTMHNDKTLTIKFNVDASAFEVNFK